MDIIKYKLMILSDYEMIQSYELNSVFEVLFASQNTQSY